MPILFIYIWPVTRSRFGIIYQSDFHMMGRSACDLPSGWHSKKDRHEEIEKINDPKQSLHDAYPITRRPGTKIIKICFCASSTTTR